MRNIGISKNAEIIEVDRVEKKFVGLNSKGRERQEKNKERENAHLFERRCKTDNANSYATERILKANFEKEWKANPGNRSEIIRKYMRKG